MSEILLQHELDRLLDEIDGELTSRSRVVDALLDLRLVVGVRDDVIAALDSMLTGIPGRTTVPNDWWMEQLGALRLLLSTEPTVV